MTTSHVVTAEAALEARPCLPASFEIRSPAHALPANATDCHCHTFEATDRYPMRRDGSYLPPPATHAEYMKMCGTLGIGRTVQVNASVYGYDNSVSLDVIAKLGQHRARGVAGIPVDVAHAELERLHAGGMRGARLSTKVTGYGGTERIEALAQKIRPYGWHVQLHFADNATLADIEQRLLDLPTAIVIDHLGGVRGSQSPDVPGFQALLRLLRRRDDCWVKISSWYRLSAAGAPYDDMKPFALAVVDARPDRVVWGTNWPHPNRYPPQAVPHDADLVDVFCAWFPDAATRRTIMADNPAKLYGF